MATANRSLRAWVSAAAIAAAIAGIALLFSAPPKSASAPRGAGENAASLNPPSAQSQASARAFSFAARAEAPRARGQIAVQAPWGSDSGALGQSRPKEGAPEAPMSFSIDASGAARVLDQVNQRVVLFEPGRPPHTIALPADTCQDIETDLHGNTIVLDRLSTASLVLIDSQGNTKHSIPIVGDKIPEGGLVTGMFARSDGLWLEVEHRELVRIADAEGAPDPARPSVPGRFSGDGRSALLAGISGGTNIQLNASPIASGGISFSASIAFPARISGIHALECDAAGRIFIAASTLLEGPPPTFELLEAHTYVVALSPNGRELGRIEISPLISPLEQFRPIRVGPDGSIYELVPGEDGVRIERYTL